MALALSPRRWLGGILLLVAIAMLVAGETLLKERLVGTNFLGYWLFCLVLTSMAIVIALRDLRTQRQRARAEEKELLQSTLEEIQRKAAAKAGSAKPPLPAKGSWRGGNPPASEDQPGRSRQ